MTSNTFAAAELSFERRRGIINARALELLAALGVQPPVICARRDEDAFRAKSVGLKLRAIGQVAAADSGWEAEKVFDQGRGAGLPSGRV